MGIAERCIWGFLRTDITRFATLNFTSMGVTSHWGGARQFSTRYQVNAISSQHLRAWVLELLQSVVLLR